MKSTALVLAGLFIAQLAVAGVLYYSSWSQRSVRPQGNLLALSADDVNQISIDGEGETVTLEKKEDSWVIASSGLPAETSRVDAALQSVANMKSGWAVASTDASHQQLEVADDNYQRRVTIGNEDETVGDIYIGTSPGFKRSHVRMQGADEVYSVAINTFDLPPEPVNWLDKTLLQVKDISSVTISDKELVRADEQWIYNGDDNTDQDVASELVSAFESLRVTDLADVVAEDLEFQQFKLKAGDEEYEFGLVSEGDDHLVSRQDIDAVFKISKSSFDKVVAVELVKPEPEPEPEPDNKTSEQDADDKEAPASGAGQSVDEGKESAITPTDNESSSGQTGSN